MRLIDLLWPSPGDLSHYVIATGPLPAKSVAFIWYFVRLLRLPVLVISVCFASATILFTLEAYFTGRIVLAVTQSNASLLWQRVLPIVAWYLILCQLLSRIFYNTAHALLNRTGPVLGMIVRERLAGYLYQHSYSYFQEEFSGRLAGKVMEMPQAVKDTVYEALDTFIYLSVVGLTATVLFACIHWSLAAFAISYFLATIWIAYSRIPDFAAASDGAATAQQTMRGRYIDSISNILLVKLFAREKHERSRLSDTLIHAGTAEQNQGRQEVRWYRIQHMANFSFQSGVILLSLELFRRGGLTIGNLTTAISLSIAIAANVWYMMHFTAHFFARFAVIDDALKTILQSQEIKDDPNSVSLAPNSWAVSLKNVTFAYPSRPVFQGFSLTIPEGQKVGLVGPSGAGKSTLMQLLLRLSDVQAGAIVIGGQDIRRVKQTDLRNAITVIPQATELMHRSVLDNICYGDLDATLEQVQAAAQRAHIHETIESLRDGQGNTGYSALVGERGVKLSGGQRQRIAIARAFLKDARILILDEATSALDSESERSIQASFVELFEGRTVIAIAHRLSTIAHLDRIIVLEQGQIVEDGTHIALLAAGGLYSRLWSLQSKGFIGTGAAAVFT